MKKSGRPRFSKIYGRSFWPRVAALSNDAQLLFVYAMTHPDQTSLGAMIATPEGLAAEKRLRGKRGARAWSEIVGQGLLEACEEHAVVWVPEHVKENQPESPNVVAAWTGAAARLPKCHLTDFAIERAGQALEGKSKPFREAFHKAFGGSLGEKPSGEVLGGSLGGIPRARDPKSRRAEKPKNRNEGVSPVHTGSPPRRSTSEGASPARARQPEDETGSSREKARRAGARNRRALEAPPKTLRRGIKGHRRPSEAKNTPTDDSGDAGTVIPATPIEKKEEVGEP